MLIIVVLLYFLMVAVYLRIITKGRRILNPAFLWVVVQVIFFLGTILNIDTYYKADIVLVYLMFLGTFFFLTGTVIVDLASTNARVKSSEWLKQPMGTENPQFMKVVWILISFSFLISFFYYRQIGYNVFLESIRAYFIQGNGLIEDISTLRLNTYATGPKYLAPGYVNQFKNMILPLLLGYVYVLYQLSQTKTVAKKVILIFLSLTNVIFLMGTGQRAPLVYVIIILLLFFYVSLPSKLFRRISLIILFGGVILFLLQTFFLGRSGIETLEGGRNFMSLITDMWHRVFTINQVSGIIGFRYIYAHSVQWGSDWWADLVALLPGRRSTISLANIIHAARYGSFRGTSPPTIWGSIWYNFEMLGIILVPFFMGIFYQWVYSRLVSGPKTLFRLLYYSAITILLGTWAVNGPDFVMQRGLIGVLLMGLLDILFDRTSMYQRRGPDYHTMASQTEEQMGALR